MTVRTTFSHDDAKTLAGLAATTTILAIPIGAFWRAFVIAALWRWFAVPFGAPVLPVAAVFGLLLIASLLLRGIAREPVKEKELGAIMCALWSETLLVPGLALVSGWAVQRWWL